MVDYIDGRKESAMSLLEKSVNINSGTMNFSGVRKVADQLVMPLTVTAMAVVNGGISSEIVPTTSEPWIGGKKIGTVLGEMVRIRLLDR